MSFKKKILKPKPTISISLATSRANHVTKPSKDLTSHAKNVPKNILGSDSESDEDLIINLELYSSKDGTAKNLEENGETNGNSVESLVIIPKSRNAGWRKRRRYSRASTPDGSILYNDKTLHDHVVAEETTDNDFQSLEETNKVTGSGLESAALIKAREYLKTGKTDENEGLIIPISSNPLEEDRDVTEEQYQKVPVDAFGAAMLRGMGWKPKGTRGKDYFSSLSASRKRGELLGIGAKPLDRALQDELGQKKHKKFEVPVIRREK